mmetsp:Transcript_35549/g.77836  ORF Transcript_35549/g.77836 Transcript_35549/m.77836 type:complete len:118 (+) Transcript_35549:858-1211(+)
MPWRRPWPGSGKEPPRCAPALLGLCRDAAMAALIVALIVVAVLGVMTILVRGVPAAIKTSELPPALVLTLPPPPSEGLTAERGDGGGPTSTADEVERTGGVAAGVCRIWKGGVAVPG